MPKAARIDANHGEVVAAFRAVGCTVVSLAMLGNGIPDLLVGVAGRNLLVEIKDGSKPPSKRKLTTDQVTFKEMWRGGIIYIDDVKAVVPIVNAIRRSAA